MVFFTSLPPVDLIHVAQTFRLPSMRNVKSNTSGDGCGLAILRSPPSPHDSLDPPVNIVYVHGLGGPVRNVWTDVESGCFWPLWLPEINSLKNARIMVFGYDSGSKGLLTPTNGLDISSFAKQLANDLYLHYADHGDEQTVFIAHSIGGLVVKKAIIIAHNNGIYKRVIKNAIGIMFLGTPHRGADFTNILKILLGVTFPEPRFVGDLSPTSQTIKEINEDFAHRAESLKLASFWESTGMPIVGIVVRDSSATLGSGWELRVPLNGDHISITKFSSRQDNNYRVVSKTLAQLIKAARDPPSQADTHIPSDSAMTPVAQSHSVRPVFHLVNKQAEDEQFLKWLSPSYWPVEGQLHELKKQRAKDTLKWASDMAVFENWRTSNPLLQSKERILWIRGPPGVGKSTLAAYFIEQLKHLHPTSIVLYFFCRRGQAGLTKAREIIQTLTYQLICASPEARSILEPLQRTQFQINEKLPVSFLCERLLSEPSRHTKDEIYVIIDGLDEADSSETTNSITQSMSDLDVLICCLADIPSARLLFISRPTTNISKLLPNSVTQSIGNNENIHDIDNYVTQTIQDSRSLKEYFESEGVDPVKYFHEKANGIFLWVSLVLRQLGKAKSKAVFQRDLHQFSEARGDMERLYSQIMSSIEVDDQRWIKEILRWLVIADGELNVEQLREAVQVGVQDVPTDFQSFLEVECGSMVHVIRGLIDTTVQLLHETFRSFLTNPNCSNDFYVDEERNHSYVFSAYLDHLSREQRVSNISAGYVPSDGEVDDFDQFASTHWVAHLTKANHSDSGTLIRLHRFFRSDGIKEWIMHDLLYPFGPLYGRALDIHVEERPLQEVFTYLIKWRPATNRHNLDINPDGSNHENDEYSQAVKWRMDVLETPWTLGESVGKAAGELWISVAENADMFYVFWLFALALKYFCRRKCLQVLEDMDLELIADEKFANILSWLGDVQKRVRLENLGFAFYAVRHWGNAILSLEKAIDNVEENIRIVGYLHRACMRTGDVDRAIRRLKEMTETCPSLAWTWEYLGDACLASGDYEGAIQAYSVAFEEDDILFRPWPMFRFEHLHEAYMQMNDYDGEIAVFERAVVGYGHHAWWAWQYLAEAYKAKGDLQLVVNVYERAQEQNPDEHWALEGLHYSRTEIAREKSGALKDPELQHGSREYPRTTGVQNEFTFPVSGLRQSQYVKHLGDDCLVVYNKTVPCQLRATLVHTLQHNTTVNYLQFSLDGAMIGIGSYGSVVIFNVSTGARIATFIEESTEFIQNEVLSLCFSPDGRTLATGGQDEVVRIWDIEQNTVVSRIVQFREAISLLDFSPDGSRLVVGSPRGTIMLWDIALAKPRFTASLPLNDTSVFFAPDNRLMYVFLDPQGLRWNDLEDTNLVHHTEDIGFDMPMTASFIRAEKISGIPDNVGSSSEPNPSIRPSRTQGCGYGSVFWSPTWKKLGAPKRWPDACVHISNSTVTFSVDDYHCIGCWTLDEHPEFTIAFDNVSGTLQTWFNTHFTVSSIAHRSHGMSDGVFAVGVSDGIVMIWRYDKI